MDSYSWSIDSQQNLIQIKRFISDRFESTKYEFDVSTASFKHVYESALDVQQHFLTSILHEKLKSFLRNGSILSIALAYRESTITKIDAKKDGKINFTEWNRYADEYNTLNSKLDEIAEALAQPIDGIALPTTTEEPTDAVSHVRDYFPACLSHRHVAEYAGLGWRGKNGLIIHPKYSCAVRFVSILTEIPLAHGSRKESQCGSCTACEDACPFIKHRHNLSDYRENCRRYISYLMRQGLNKSVCGKCIKACVFQSVHKDVFELTH